MKKNSIIFLTTFFLASCDNSDDVSQVNKLLTIGCKYNPGALYEDTFIFYEDRTVSRSSTNKNDKNQTSYKFREQGDEYILIGDETFIDINNVKTVIPDSDLYVVKKGYGSGSYNIFYTIDYETDPTRLFVCKQKWKEKKQITVLFKSVTVE